VSLARFRRAPCLCEEENCRREPMLYSHHIRDQTADGGHSSANCQQVAASTKIL